MIFKKLNIYLQCTLFCSLFIATCYVNKYVLSVLKFTHPTIFQGWQSFLGVIFIKSNIMAGNINLLLTGNRKFFLHWLPEFILFGVSIYSGSKALANISIPALLSVLNSCVLINHISMCVLQWNFKIYDVKDWIFHFVIGGSAIGVVYSDPMYQIEGYFWLYVHIISFSAIVIFIEFNKDIIEASQIELLYYNYMFSVVLFIPGSYLLGDIFEAANFKHLYLYKFYMGCFASGILGAMLNLLRISLQEDSEFLYYNRLLPVTHIIASFLSLLLFEFQMSLEHNIWIIIIQLASLFRHFTKRKVNE